jgi:hypothetical protein
LHSLFALAFLYTSTPALASASQADARPTEAYIVTLDASSEQNLSDDVRNALDKALDKALDYASVTWSSTPDLDTNALRSALLHDARLCAPSVPDDSAAFLESQVQDGRALYVSVWLGERVNNTALWRWSTEDQHLRRVMNVGKAQLDAAWGTPADHGPLVLLPWPDASPKTKAEQVLQSIDADYTVLDHAQSIDLIEALMEHPNACHPELPDALYDVVQAHAGDAPLQLAVAMPSAKTPFVWRYDNATGVLARAY